MQVSNAGKQLKLSLQIPQRYSNFGNSVNDGKNVLMFQGLGSSTGDARHSHVMKATTPIPVNETSPLLTLGGRTLLERASLASYIRAFSWNRSASVPVTPVSTSFVLYLLPYIIFLASCIHYF